MQNELAKQKGDLIKSESLTKNKVEKNQNRPKLPRRYGKDKINKDIVTQGGKATPLQLALMEIYELRNIHSNLALRGIKDMFGDGNNFSEEDCIQITSLVETFKNEVDLICKKPKKG